MRSLHSVTFSLLCAITLAAQTATKPSLRLEVDGTDAARNFFHAKVTMPVAPGVLTLAYPEWIPGNHRPSGPVMNMTGLRIEGGGKTIRWQRDLKNMYEIHVQVPAGVNEITASFDEITNSGVAGGSGASASENVLDVNWNQVVLYPASASSDDVQVKPSIHLPDGWKFGTALTVANQNGGLTEFEPVSLTTLVDSPLIAGSHFRQVELTTPGESPRHVMDLVGESEASINMSANDVAAYKRLVAETGALFGARHYLHYDFLVTFSDEVGGRGLEHHQSSDNAPGEKALSDPSTHLLNAGLLPHEFTHSWNGKYRRPAGLATRNYQEPMTGDLLWVYEGLTEYLGNVLTARTALWTPKQYQESLAETAAALDYRAGRSWRSLEDTAVSVQMLRLAPGGWQNWRRGLDYYPEGELVWLQVDTRIRQLTNNQKSLDDFCRAFHGGQSGPPAVVPYTFDDIVRGLNAVAPDDWAGLLHQLVDAVQPHAPLGGIEQGGWRLVYNDTPNDFVKAVEGVAKMANFTYSLGFYVSAESGTLGDVIVGSPAFKAGLGPGMKMIAVNGRKYSSSKVNAALIDARNSKQPIQLLVENAHRFRTVSIDYYDGPRHPHLERVSAEPDLLGDIIKPRSGIATRVSR
ncbi:MAG: M61 family metallopeptidase [Terriglobales bacterium]|jgi:predicted metalloprotease with PDZ domain